MSIDQLNPFSFDNGFRDSPILLIFKYFMGVRHSHGRSELCGAAVRPRKKGGRRDSDKSAGLTRVFELSSEHLGCHRRRSPAPEMTALAHTFPFKKGAERGRGEFLF